jgi:hypothetical protein
MGAFSTAFSTAFDVGDSSPTLGVDIRLDRPWLFQPGVAMPGYCLGTPAGDQLYQHATAPAAIRARVDQQPTSIAVTILNEGNGAFSATMTTFTWGASSWDIDSAGYNLSIPLPTLPDGGRYRVEIVTSPPTQWAIWDVGGN